MSQRLDGAVVGTGTIGQVHARVLAEHAGTNLAGVVDLDDASARSVGERYGADRIETTTESVLESIDFVVVATPESAHLEPTERALSADCDVLLEKPIAATVDDAERIGTLVESAAGDLMMGFSLRCDRRYAGLKRRVDDGDFGRLLGVQAARIANQYVYRGAAEWADLATYLASHDIDAMRWFVGEPITRVTAEAGPPLDGEERPAVIHATLRFANGTVGVLETNWGRSDSYPAHRTDEVRLTGTDGYARLVHEAEDDDVTISTDGPTDEGHDTGRPEGPAHRYLPTAELHGRRADTYRWQIDYFVDVVRDERPPLATWRDGARALEVATALTESCQTGRPVEVSESEPGSES